MQEIAATSLTQALCADNVLVSLLHGKDMTPEERDKSAHCPRCRCSSLSATLQRNGCFQERAHDCSGHHQRARERNRRSGSTSFVKHSFSINTHRCHFNR